MDELISLILHNMLNICTIISMFRNLNHGISCKIIYSLCIVDTVDDHLLFYLKFWHKLCKNIPQFPAIVCLASWLHKLAAAASLDNFTVLPPKSCEIVQSTVLFLLILLTYIPCVAWIHTNVVFCRNLQACNYNTVILLGPAVENCQFSTCVRESKQYKEVRQNSTIIEWIKAVFCPWTIIKDI